MSFVDLLDEYLPPLRGTQLEGRVVGMDDYGLLVEPFHPFKYQVIHIPYRAVGARSYSEGDDVTFQLVAHEDDEERAIGSIRASKTAEARDMVTKQSLISVEVIEVVSAKRKNTRYVGVIGSYDDHRVFIPRSHLILEDEDIPALIGRNVDAMVFQTDDLDNLVASVADVAVREELGEVDVPKIGERVKGIVSGRLASGIVLALGNGYMGYCSKKDLDWVRVKDPRESVKLGAILDVVVTKFHDEHQQATVSRRLALPNPWLKFRHREGEVVEAQSVYVLPEDKGTLLRVLDSPAIVGRVNVDIEHDVIVNVRVKFVSPKSEKAGFELV